MNESTIANGIEALSRCDDDVARAVAIIGLPAPRIRPAGFETLLNTIVSQQISTEAARAIMGRVTALMATLEPKALQALEAKQLRQAGMSFRKIEYAQGLAQAVNDRTLDIDGLARMDDTAAITAITELRGFGRWSAEIYLMFSLQRQDIFPADDLALQVALGRLKGLEQRPSAKQSRQMVEHWAPWRSVGSLFLWHYYRGAP
ncbi:MAG: DNA-3-methyladenine glycosylase 2 family protein [Motiliproteus sp.]